MQIEINTSVTTTTFVPETTSTTEAIDPLTVFLQEIEDCRRQEFISTAFETDISSIHNFFENSLICEIENEDPNLALSLHTSWLIADRQNTDLQLNENLQSSVLETASSFLEDVEIVSSDPEWTTALPASLFITSSLSFDSPRVISVKISFDAYYAGRIRTEHWVLSKSLDATTGVEITIDQLFSADKEWLPLLIELIETAVDENYPEATTGGWPLEDELDSFVLSADGISFDFLGVFFSSMGNVSVTIPWNNITDFLNPNGPVGEFATSEETFESFQEEVIACSNSIPSSDPIEHHAGWVHSFESYFLSCSNPYEWGGISFDAEWTEISGNLADTAINNAIQNLMTGEITQYLDWALETTELNKEDDLSFGTDSYAQWGTQIALDDPDLLSLVINHWSFFSGSANGNTSFFSLNFDPQSGQVIELEDLFIAGSDWVPILGQAAYTEINAQFDEAEIDSPELWWGWPSPTVFEDFALSNEGLIVLFDEYDIAPGVFGSLSGTIPWNNLVEIIDPNGPVGKFLIS